MASLSRWLAPVPASVGDARILEHLFLNFGSDVLGPTSSLDAEALDRIYGPLVDLPPEEEEDEGSYGKNEEEEKTPSSRSSGGEKHPQKRRPPSLTSVSSGGGKGNRKGSPSGVGKKRSARLPSTKEGDKAGKKPRHTGEGGGKDDTGKSASGGKTREDDDEEEEEDDDLLHSVTSDLIRQYCHLMLSVIHPGNKEGAASVIKKDEKVRAATVTTTLAEPPGEGPQGHDGDENLGEEEDKGDVEMLLLFGTD